MVIATKVWDTGRFLSLKGVYQTGYAVLGASTAATLYLTSLWTRMKMIRYRLLFCSIKEELQGDRKVKTFFSSIYLQIFEHGLPALSSNITLAL
jgi:hypothetical protein